MNLTQVSVLEHGADYTLEGVTITIPIKMDNSTYILTTDTRLTYFSVLIVIVTPLTGSQILYQ